MKLPLNKRREIRKKGWYKNEAESAAKIFFQKNGIESARRGYPDFTILKNNEIAGFIEVKPNNQKALKCDQLRFQRFCDLYGIPFIKWTPEDGETAITDFFDRLS